MSPDPNSPATFDTDNNPPFEQPWHAQVFALTHKLAEAGHYTWPEWAAAFAAALEKARLAGGPVDGSDYYDVWLETFQSMLVRLEIATATEISELVSAWKAAYLRTPHGQPVDLNSN